MIFTDRFIRHARSITIRTVQDIDAQSAEEPNWMTQNWSLDIVPSAMEIMNIVRIICLPIHTTRIYDQRFIKKIKEEVYYV